MDNGKTLDDVAEDSLYHDSISINDPKMIEFDEEFHKNPTFKKESTNAS